MATLLELHICIVKLGISLCGVSDTYTYKHIYMYIYIYMYVCMYVYMYVYMYICMYIYIYMSCTNVKIYV